MLRDKGEKTALIQASVCSLFFSFCVVIDHDPNLISTRRKQPNPILNTRAPRSVLSPTPLSTEKRWQQPKHCVHLGSKRETASLPIQATVS